MDDQTSIDIEYVNSDPFHPDFPDPNTPPFFGINTINSDSDPDTTIVNNGQYNPPLVKLIFHPENDESHLRLSNDFKIELTPNPLDSIRKQVSGYYVVIAETDVNGNPIQGGFASSKGFSISANDNGKIILPYNLSGTIPQPKTYLLLICSIVNQQYFSRPITITNLIIPNNQKFNPINSVENLYTASTIDMTNNQNGVNTFPINRDTLTTINEKLSSNKLTLNRIRDRTNPTFVVSRASIYRDPNNNIVRDANGNTIPISWNWVTDGGSPNRIVQQAPVQATLNNKNYYAQNRVDSNGHAILVRDRNNNAIEVNSNTWMKSMRCIAGGNGTYGNWLFNCSRLAGWSNPLYPTALTAFAQESVYHGASATNNPRMFTLIINSPTLRSRLSRAIFDSTVRNGNTAWADGTVNPRVYATFRLQQVTNTDTMDVPQIVTDDYPPSNTWTQKSAQTIRNMNLSLTDQFGFPKISRNSANFVIPANRTVTRGTGSTQTRHTSLCRQFDTVINGIVLTRGDSNENKSMFPQADNRYLVQVRNSDILGTTGFGNGDINNGAIQSDQTTFAIRCDTTQFQNVNPNAFYRIEVTFHIVMYRPILDHFVKAPRVESGANRTFYRGEIRTVTINDFIPMGFVKLWGTALTDSNGGINRGAAVYGSNTNDQYIPTNFYITGLDPPNVCNNYFSFSDPNIVTSEAVMDRKFTFT